jgi:hypothetical protein
MMELTRLVWLVGFLASIGVANAEHPELNLAASSAWEHVGPWNIYGGTNPTVSAGMGEAGTLASAASLAAVPDLIYAGGQNNGVSSGVIKTIDGGIHWTRQSKGLWDTRINAVWIHPDDPKGGHVFAGTHSGIYESKDFAESWQLANETANWGMVLSFRQGKIDGKDYIVANAANGFILTRPLADGTGPWQQAKAPGGNPTLSIVTTAGKSEVLTCVNKKLYFGALDSPTSVTWDEPMKLPTVTYTDWAVFNNSFSNGIYGITKMISPGCNQERKPCTPTSCPGIHNLGKMPTPEACQTAAKGKHAFPVASWAYIPKRASGCICGCQFLPEQTCYVSSTFTTWDPKTEGVSGITSGRAPGVFGGEPIECEGLPAVDPKDRNHFLYVQPQGLMHSEDGGKTIARYANHSRGIYMTMIDKHG